MSEFCSMCYAKHGFDRPDVDLNQLFDELPEGHMSQFTCEGCSVVAVGKVGGKMFIDTRQFIKGDRV